VTCTLSPGRHLKDFPLLVLELRDLIERESITKRAPGEPDFVLASGKHSRYYCDLKKILLSPRGAELVGEVFFHLLDETGIEAVGGLQLGATFIATVVALVSAQHGRGIYGFSVRDSQKTHGTLERVAESFHPSGKLLAPGRKVAIVDDVVTLGGSILKAIRAVQDLRCEIAAVVALVDRNEGGAEVLKKQEKLPYFPIFRADASGNLTINEALIGDPQRRRIVSL
jgi:orotate phosphoribosyltransferase